MPPGESTKVFTRGSHRSVIPAQTLRTLKPLLPQFGITRVADVTGLDNIGIPTVQAIRPNSRSLSVSQGKGIDLESAMVSAIMESVEQFYAERPAIPLSLGSYEEVAGRSQVVDVLRLPRYVRPFHPQTPMLWAQAERLEHDEPTWLPFDLVHLNLSLPLVSGTGFFPIGSNGLASGNTLAEATAHALCELIERDCVALFHRRPANEQAACRLVLDSVNEPNARELLARFAHAGVDVVAWDVSSEVGIACFYCMIIEHTFDEFRRVGKAVGFGCHVDRGVALCRALTEAAQSRLTRITGSRDDIQERDFHRIRASTSILQQQWEMQQYGHETRFFADVPTRFLASAEHDVGWLLERLRRAGFDSAYRVALSRAHDLFSVVRVVVPGLEGASDTPGYVPGQRANALERERELLS